MDVTLMLPSETFIMASAPPQNQMQAVRASVQNDVAAAGQDVIIMLNRLPLLNKMTFAHQDIKPKQYGYLLHMGKFKNGNSAPQDVWGTFNRTLPDTGAAPSVQFFVGDPQIQLDPVLLQNLNHRTLFEPFQTYLATTASWPSTSGTMLDKQRGQTKGIVI